MNDLWLLIPVKQLGQGKSRLAALLTPHQRADLTRRILSRTLALAAETDCFAEILVVSADPVAHELAAQAGASSLCEAPMGLNGALVQARAHALARGAGATLVLPADLPLLTAADVTTIVGRAETGNQVVLAPSHDCGTNALLLTPPGIIDFAFGPESFRHHKQAAAARNARVAVVRTPSLAFDVDWPSDLRWLHSASSPQAAR